MSTHNHPGIGGDLEDHLIGRSQVHCRPSGELLQRNFLRRQNNNLLRIDGSDHDIGFMDV